MTSPRSAYPTIDPTRGIQDRVTRATDTHFERQMEREIAAQRAVAVEAGEDGAVYDIVEALPWEHMRGRGRLVREIVTLLADADFREAYRVEIASVDATPSQ